MKLDILVVAAHPDDAELGCGGTIAKHVDLGLKVGILDLTRGELGTRGSPETRQREAAHAAAILGVTIRENMNFSDGFFANDSDHQLSLIKKIRNLRPDIVLAPAIMDRHPDHGRAAQLTFEACFLSGLAKIQTVDDAEAPQAAWRPGNIYHYIQSQLIQPDFIVDVTPYWEKKEEAIRAYRTQFYDPVSSEPETFVSRPIFLDMVRSRAIDLGVAIGVQYGEGFTTRRPPGVTKIPDLL